MFIFYHVDPFVNLLMTSYFKIMFHVKQLTSISFTQINTVQKNQTQ